MHRRPRSTTMPAMLSLEAGRVVAGRYRLERKLGEGGMGVVWAAMNLVAMRPVALKVLKSSGGAGDQHARERFLREARAANVVRHPSIVPVHDVLELEDGSLGMVMDLLRGESLADRLGRRGALPLAEVAPILLRVCDAMAAAHAQGIVHRDLKPDNIFLAVEPDGSTSVKVLDFGVAKLVTLGFGAVDAMTQTGALLGTPFYMSPEQLLGQREVDHRADLWAVGVILYEALAGARPTEAPNLGQIVALVITGSFPPLWERAPTVPQPVLDLVGRLLRRDREERPADMGEVIAVLAPFAHGSVAPPPPLRSLPVLDASPVAFAPTQSGDAPVIPRGRRTRSLATAAALAPLALLVTAGVGLYRARHHAPHPARDVATYMERRLTVLPAEEYIREAKLTPDASQLVFAANDAFWVESTRGGDRRRLALPPSEPGDAYAGLSMLPDGKSVLATLRRGARVLSFVAPLDGGPARLHREGTGSWVIASPDAKRLLVGVGGTWRIGPFDGAVGADTVLLPLPVRATFAFSPDGASIVAWEDGDPPQLSVVTADGASQRRIFADASLKDGAGLPGLVWPEPGRIVFSARNGESSVVREVLLDASGNVTSHARDLWTSRLGAIDTIDVARGRIAAVIGTSQNDVLVADLSGDARHLVGSPRAVASREAQAGWPSWLPDGRVSYLAAPGGDGSKLALYAQASAGSEPAIVVDPPLFLGPYTVLRTGEILFSRPGGDAGKRSVVLARPGKPSREVTTIEDHSGADWKSFVVRCGNGDPTRCVLGSLRSGVMSLSRFDPSTGHADPPFFAEPKFARFAVSPDGATVAVADEGPVVSFVSTATGATRTTSIFPPGQTLQYCDFTPDGRTLVIAGLAFPNYGLAAVGLDGRGTMLRSTTSAWMHHVAVSPDGHKLAFAQRTYDTDVWLLEAQ